MKKKTVREKNIEYLEKKKKTIYKITVSANVILYNNVTLAVNQIKFSDFKHIYSQIFKY